MLEWVKLTPALTPEIADSTNKVIDLDTPDELALRSLLVGINQRTMGSYKDARSNLTNAYAHRSEVKVSTWIAGVAMFELAVLDLKELEAAQRDDSDLDASEGRRESESVTQTTKPAKSDRVTDWNTAWVNALQSASAKLDTALGLATGTTDFSSRLDSRIAMLRDEIAIKRGMLNILAE